MLRPTRNFALAARPVDGRPPFMNAGDSIWAARTRPVTFTIEPSAAAKAGRVERTRPAPEILNRGDLVNRRYRVERLLGRGGMGAVYLAADTVKDGHLVALKMLTSCDLSDEAVALLKNEFETLDHLAHPNLAAVYDFEVFRGTNAHFLTMEYVEGAVMDTTARGAAWDHVLDLIVQVCRALAYLHSRNVIHFDLKPANIMVTPEGKVKVLDFGLAGARAYQARKGELLVSPGYMAPELALYTATADHRADLYSLGIILYQFLTGALPFEGSTAQEILKAHCYEALVFKAESEQVIPAWLRSLVSRLCAKEPSDRFRTANAVIEEINRTGGCTYEVETRQTRESYLLSSRFVARADEFKRIMGHVERNLSDEPGGKPALFVAGVSGAGKSRLLKEVRHHLQLSRVSFVEANCYSGSLSEFAPMMEAVRHAVTLAEADGHADALAAHGPELAKLDPMLAQQRGWKPVADTEHPEAQRQRVIQHVADFLLEAAGTKGFTLYINDLQWALPGTVDILAYLLRRLTSLRESGRPVRFCLLGSYREDEVMGHPIARLLDELRTRDHVAEIALSPLSRDNVAVLLGSMLGIESPPQPFVTQVHAESGGNPYFVEELMRTLVESGAVFLENGKWATSRDTSIVKLPRSISDALAKRFAMLDEGLRELVELMAAHAQPVPVKVLQAITGEKIGALEARLNTLASRRMATMLPDRETAYRVAHDRLRESVYEAIPLARRIALHGVLARGLASVYTGNQDEVIYDLARHAWEADDRGHALDYSLQAGEKARLEYANDLGIVLYRRVLELLPAGDRNDVRLDVQEKLGEMSFLTGAYGEASRYYAMVSAAATDPLVRARLMRKQAAVHLARGELGIAREKLWETAGLLGGEHPRTRRQFAMVHVKHVLLHLLFRCAPFLIRKARDEASRRRLQELSAVYVEIMYAEIFMNPAGIVLPTLICTNASVRLGDSPQLCHAYSVLGMVYATCGLAGGADRFGEAAIAIGERLNMSLPLGKAYNYRGMSLFFMARLKEAEIALEKSRQILASCGDLLEIGVCQVNLTYAHIYQGHFQAALAAADEGLRRGRECSAMVMVKGNLGMSTYIRAKSGNLDHVEEDVAEAIRLCEETGDVLSLSAVYGNSGDWILMLGKVDEAIDRLRKAIEIRKKHNVIQTYSVGAYACLVRAAWEKHLLNKEARGKRMPARERSQLRSLSRKAVLLARAAHPTHLCPAYIARGLSHWMDGHPRAAQRCFRKGFDAALRQQAPMWLAEGYFDAGRCLLLSKQTRLEGIGFLEQAKALFAEQGCKVYLDRTHAILEAEGRKTARVGR